MSKYCVHGDTEIDYQDVPPWRSYNLYASGDSLQELLENMTISETDQDGGEIRTYSIDDAPNEVIRRSFEMIEEEIIRVNRLTLLKSRAETERQLNKILRNE